MQDAETLPQVVVRAPSGDPTRQQPHGLRPTVEVPWTLLFQGGKQLRTRYRPPIYSSFSCIKRR
jgi:hypothetical protein